jgi:hypothetical protein
MAAHSAAHRTHRKKGKHRARSEQRIAGYAWLGAGAVTLGIGAAMANGVGVASADTGADDGSTTSATQSTPASQASNAGGSQPNDAPHTKPPASTVGAGRDGAVGDDTDESSAGGSTSASPSAGKGPVTSLAASGGNVKTKIKGDDKTSHVVHVKKPDKLDPADDVDDADDGAVDDGTVDDVAAAPSTPSTTSPEIPSTVVPEKSVAPEKSSKPLAAASDVEAEPAKDIVAEPTPDTAADPAPEAAAGPVPWSLNPFRPMPPEPAPNDMPGQLWNVEQAVIKAFDPVPFMQPFVREGFEAGFRVSQMIPFVNAVIPIVNIVDQLPHLASSDPVVVRDAAQSIINNLIVTLHPVSVLYYGYDEIADLINLEYQAQELKEWFYTTAWNVLDPFTLLHNRGESGLPLSQSTPTAAPSVPVVALASSTTAIAATTDDPGSSPFRPDDPDPAGMPGSLTQVRNLVMSALPDQLDPIFREAFEFVYRGSQMVPFVNTVVPIFEILPALVQALGGDKAGAQIAINQLLLTTGPVSVLYYGYDQIADLLNIEEAAFAAKEQLYIGLWDAVDPSGLLHNVGASGLMHL